MGFFLCIEKVGMANKFDGDVVALELLENITSGLDFTIPNVDFSDESFKIPQDLLDALNRKVEPLSNDSLTTRKVDGSGVFDYLMSAVAAHLEKEYNAGRITGAEYTKAYTSAIGTAMQSAVQFLLNRDKAYWDGIQAQFGAIGTNIGVNKAKVDLAIAQAQAHQNKAQYALTVLQLATQDAQYAVAKEQHEAVRAQTLDARTDGATVVGSVGKQKALYDQQITSYKRDAENKFTKLLVDAWITQKSMDEGLTAPSELQNSAMDRALKALRTNNGIQ